MSNLKTLRGSVAIVGVAESDAMGKLPHTSALQLHMEATRNALDDAGLQKSDIDASPPADMAADLPESSALTGASSDGTPVGGCSFILHVEHALAAINAGLCEVALITHGESGYRVSPCRHHAGATDSTNNQFELPGTWDRLPGYGFLATAHARVRHHQRAAGRSRRGAPAMGGDQIQGDDAGADSPSTTCCSRAGRVALPLLDCCLVDRCRRRGRATIVDLPAT